VAAVAGCSWANDRGVSRHRYRRTGAGVTSGTTSDAASTMARDRVGTVTRMTRQCSRTGCASPAVATLTYQYGRSLVWIDDLAPERDPHSYDLCERHAARLSVPNGWSLEERRQQRVLVSAGHGLAPQGFDAHRLAG